MREILFRGKRMCNNKWMVGSLLYYEDGDCYICCDNFRLNHYRVDPETVGQFTGLTDKNGKKIFEGDILQSWSDYHKNYYYCGIVRYGEFNCSCCDGVYGWYLDGGDIRKIDSYEVCGNIHDNPELQEVSHD